jgi:hypothetical protein
MDIQARKNVFRDLVHREDTGQAVANARSAILEGYGLTLEQLFQIEKEGISHGWLEEMDKEKDK